MAQFDVYVNQSKASRKIYPYLLDIQNPAISDIATRIVLPIGRLSNFRNKHMNRLTLQIDYEGEKLLVLTPQIASIPAKVLKTPVGSLAHLRNEIVAALDFATTGI